MTETRLLELMHAVLDGEATVDEASALDTRLAADPAAQAQFARLKGLFDGLKGIRNHSHRRGWSPRCWPACPRARRGRAAATNLFRRRV